MVDVPRTRGFCRSELCGFAGTWRPRRRQSSDIGRHRTTIRGFLRISAETRGLWRPPVATSSDTRRHRATSDADRAPQQIALLCCHRARAGRASPGSCGESRADTGGHGAETRGNRRTRAARQAADHETRRARRFCRSENRAERPPPSFSGCFALVWPSGAERQRGSVLLVINIEHPSVKGSAGRLAG